MNYEELMKRRKEAITKEYSAAFNSDADDGRWITTENGHHVHINAEGTPDKGNPHVVSAMKGASKSSSKKSSSSDYLRKVSGKNKEEKSEKSNVSHKELNELLYQANLSGSDYKGLVDLYGEEGAIEQVKKYIKNANSERPYDPDYDDPTIFREPSEFRSPFQASKGEGNPDRYFSDKQASAEFKSSLKSLKKKMNGSDGEPGYEAAIQEAMDLAYDNPLKFYEITSSLGPKAAGRLKFEMGPANTNAIEEVIKPAIEGAKNDLKNKIPAPSKNKSSSATINGKKITISNVRNAEYPHASRQQRFFDIRISNPETGESEGSFAANDYESAMEHVYRIAGLRTK